MKKTIRMNERELHRLISESIKEYAGYDSEKFAYGEQGDGNYIKHLERVGVGRTDQERQKTYDRQENNRKNLDKLRLRLYDNPYQNHLENVKFADNLKHNSMANLKKEINESRLHRIINESIKRVLNEHGYGNPARNNNIKKLQDTVRYVAEKLKDYCDFDEESKWCGYNPNGTSWTGRLYDDYSEKYIDINVRNYKGRVGTGNPETEPEGLEGVGGVQVTGDIYDDYGTCLHNYVCAYQGAPLGYMDRNLTPDSLVSRLLNDINIITDGWDEENEND